MIDFIGLAPGFGDVADGLNAVISYSRGNYFDAILSVGCIVFSAVADVVLKPLKWAKGTVVEKVKRISDKIDGFLPAIRNFMSGISNKVDNMLFGFKKAKAKVIEMCDNFVAYLNNLSFQINDQYAYAGIPDDYFDDVAEKSVIKGTSGAEEIFDDIITDGSHMIDGKLRPNVTYKTGEHDYIYRTNEEALICEVYVEDLGLKSHQGRLPHNPNSPGK